MNDCLVTKLKGVVNNDNLKIYNTIVTKPNTNGSIWTMQIQGTEKIELDVIGDGTFTNLDGTVDYGKHTEGISVLVKYGGTGKIKITNKYALTQLHVVSNANNDDEMFDFSDFVFNNLPDLTLTGIKVDFDVLNVPTLTTFKYGSPGHVTDNTGNLVDFLVRHPNVVAPEIVTSGSANVTGYFGSLSDELMAKPVVLLFNSSGVTDTDIATFGRCVNLQQMNFVGLQVGGTVESFVQMARSKGRTEFSNPNNKNWYFNRNITFNGSVLGEGAKNDFSWTATTITLGGVTINA